MSPRLLVAPDSFKSSFTSEQFCQATLATAKEHVPEWTVISCPMADGGEGTLRCLISARGGNYEKVQVQGPLGPDKVDAQLGFYQGTSIGDGGGKTAVVEMAEAAGLALCPPERLCPLEATTRGVGDLVKRALDAGCSELVIGLGGTATVDLGLGCLQELGFEFLDDHGLDVSVGGGALQHVRRINDTKVDARLYTTKIILAADVVSPLLGTDGAVSVYGAQKGLTPGAMSDSVEKGFQNLVKIFAHTYPDNACALHRDPRAFGAAGGMCYGLLAAIGGWKAAQARVRGGGAQCGAIVKMSGFDVLVDNAYPVIREMDFDAVITGEGQVNSQTLWGKLPIKLAQLASQKGVPVFVLTGDCRSCDLDKFYAAGVTSILSISRGPQPLAEACSNGLEDLSATLKNVLRLLRVQLNR